MKCEICGNECKRESSCELRDDYRVARVVCKDCMHDGSRRGVVHEMLSNERSSKAFYECPICKVNSDISETILSTIVTRWLLWFLIGGAIAYILAKLVGSIIMGVLIMGGLWGAVKVFVPTARVKRQYVECGHVEVLWSSIENVGGDDDKV